MVHVLSKPSTTGLREAINTITTPVTERVTWLDYLIVSTCFSIVLVHVSGGVLANTTDPFKWWVSNILGSIARWGYVFVMISGYLLLNPRKDCSLIHFYKKRASKILIPLIFWSIFYVGFSILKRYLDNEPVTLNNFTSPILAGQPYYHLWYLYMLIGLYLITPFFRKIVAASSKKELVFMCTLLFLMAITVDMINWFHFHVDFINGSPFITWSLYLLGYYLAGYLIGQVLTPKIRLFIPITLFCVAIIITAVGCYIFTARYSFALGQYFYSGLCPTIIIKNLSAFYIAKKLAGSAPKFKFVEKAALLMFGVYLIHPFFIDVLGHFGIRAIKFNPVISIPAITVLVFAISLIAAVVLKKTPYLRAVI